MKHLGKISDVKGITSSPKPLPELLEEVDFEGSPLVKLLCNEFTCLCPITGQPDFAVLEISYRPKGKIVESKSLKLYLASFRNSGMFHEKVTETICKDVSSVLKPVFMEVRGKFNPRGGILIEVISEYYSG